jgi:hypothetical protein
MGEYTIIQGQTLLVLLFAFLLTIVSSYLLTSWMRRGERLEACHFQHGAPIVSLKK